jgi:hypothetical protein
MYPTVHLNGTSQKDLLGQYCEMAYSLGKALDKMQENGPHGRDYYPQGDSALYKAQDEHRDRCNRLLKIKQEIEDIMYHINDI